MKKSKTGRYFVNAMLSWRTPEGEEAHTYRLTPTFHSRADTLDELYFEYRMDLADSLSSQERGQMRGLVVAQFHVQPVEMED